MTTETVLGTTQLLSFRLTDLSLKLLYAMEDNKLFSILGLAQFQTQCSALRLLTFNLVN